MAITEKYASSAGAGAKTGASEAAAWDFATMLTTAAAGDRVNFKGNHTLTGNAVFTNAGSATSPLIVRGYSSTIGDLQNNGRTNGNGPLITTGFPVITGGSYNIIFPAFGVPETLVATSAKNAAALVIGATAAAIRCSGTSSGTGTQAVGIGVGNQSYPYDCDATLTGGSGGLAALDLSAGLAINCRLDGGPAAALRLGTGAYGIGCSLISSATDAVVFNSTSSNLGTINCTIVTSASDGVHQIAGATRLAVTIGCQITDNGAYGIYAVDAAAGILALGNRIDRNTSGASGGATDWLSAFAGYNDTTHVANPDDEYVNDGGDDYRLKAGAPGLNIGLPLSRDIGALQRVRDYPDPSHVTSDDTVDGVTGTYAGGGGAVDFPEPLRIGA